MTIFWPKLAKTFFTLAVIASLLGGILGIAHFGMTMGEDGKMSMVDCPFMNGSSICNMTPIDHVALWQQMFTAIVQQLNILALLLLFVIISRYFLGGASTYCEIGLDFSSKRYRERVFDPLRLAFARGILHTKVY